MGLGQRGAGEPYPAAWARARLFPLKMGGSSPGNHPEVDSCWLSHSLELLLIPGSSVLRDVHTPGPCHPFLLKLGNSQEGPSLLLRPSRWNGPAWFPISSTLEIRRPTESQPSLPLGGWGSGGRGTLPQEVQVCEVGGVTESKWTCSGSGPMIMSKMETCLGHLQAPAKD